MAQGRCPAGLRFSVLGPVRVEHEGTPVPVTAPMQRAVLAVLLARERVPVSAAAIAEELWGGALPASAKVTIRNYIRRLRSLLPEGVLVSTHSGYQLTVPPRQVDARELAGLGERARALADTSPAAAVEHARQALALWGGPPLLGIGDIPLRAWWAPRLEETYLSIAELYFELELRLGRAAGVVPDLLRVNAEFPLRERIGALLMLALHHSGRAAEAIACFRRMRATIITTSGVEPGPRLRQLQQAILRGDADALAVDRLASPVVTGKTGAVAPPPVHFVGRDDVLAELGGHFDALRASEGATLTCLLHGQAGAGKSAVALTAAARFGDRFPGGVVHADLGGADSAEVLASLPEKLGIGAGEPASRYRARLRERPVLLVLDNADGLARLPSVMPAGPGCAVIVTSRSPHGWPSSVVRVQVDPLSEAESVDLLTRLIGTRAVSAEPHHALGLARLCGRLPLALGVLGARAASNPHWSLAAWERLLADDRGRLTELRHEDADVRAILLTSLENLAGRANPAAPSLFDLLGALPCPEYTPALAAALTGEPLARAERTLCALADARLVFSPSPGRYRFHELTGVLARERACSLPPEEKADALSRAGRWYLAAVRGAMERLAGSRPPHGLAKNHPVDALDPVRFGSVREARNWLDAEIGPIVEVFTALVTHRECEAATLARPFLHALAPYFDLTLRWRERERLALGVLTLAETGRPELEPVALTQFADIERQRGNPADAEFDKATAMLGHSTVLFPGEPDALSPMENQVRLHRESGDLLGSVTAGNIALSAHEQRGDFHAVLRHAMRLLPLCEELGEGYSTAECHARTARSLAALGREAEAAEHAARARAVIEAIGARERIVPAPLFDAIGLPEEHKG
ncbi:BTAD domain-containing putative transcriptional regulator [Saccharomonospora sp. NPDC006951]